MYPVKFAVCILLVTAVMIPSVIAMRAREPRLERALYLSSPRTEGGATPRELLFSFPRGKDLRLVTPSGAVYMGAVRRGKIAAGSMFPEMLEFDGKITSPTTFVATTRTHGAEASIGSAAEFTMVIPLSEQCENRSGVWRSDGHPVVLDAEACFGSGTGTVGDCVRDSARTPEAIADCLTATARISRP